MLRTKAMAIYTNLPVYEDSYQLLLCLVSFSRNMQRDFRYTLGEQVKDKVVEMMVLIFRANRSKDKTIICHADHGVGFLGAYLKPHRRYILRKTLHRISNGIKRVIVYEKPAIICNSLNSYLGILSHYYSYRLRYNIIRLNPELFRHGYFGKSLLMYRLRHTIKSDH